MGSVRIVGRPGGAAGPFGIELTAIDAVAMSPCTPPAIFIDRFGTPSISVESYDSGAPRYASMWSLIIGAPPTKPVPSWTIPHTRPASTVRNSLDTRAVATFGW